MSQTEVKSQSEVKSTDRPQGATYAKYLEWVGEFAWCNARDTHTVNERLREGWKLLGVFPYSESQTSGRWEEYHYVLGRERS